MDAKKLYRLMKPHLDLMDASERKSLLKLISTEKPQKLTCAHRKIRPLSKAKEHLKNFCNREMEKAQKNSAAM